MDFSRRRFVQAALVAPAVAAAPRPSHAQTYPTRPIHLVVGQPPGTGPDIVARLLAQWLGQRLGQSVMVENRPGAGTNVATESVVRAAPDGYTLLLSSMTNAINATLYPYLPFDFIRDIAPVAFVSDNPFVMLVTPSFPAKDVPEFIAYAKANPGKINMASGGNGSAPHVFGELFKLMAGIDLTHVPYSANLYPDLLAGQVQLAFTAIASALPFTRAGKLRVLAVTTTRPSMLLPDVPPLSRFVPGYEASAWLGVGAPKGTPVATIDQLNKDINAVIADPINKERLTALGVEPVPMSPAAFCAFSDKETKKWAKVITTAHITAE